MKRLDSPLVAAWAAALVGVVAILSSSTAEFTDRFDIVRGLLPQGMPEAAQVLTLAFGLALLILSRGLARGKRRAWVLAVALVGATAFTHLAKGLDVEEACGSLVVLAFLWRTRRHFVAPGDPESVRPLLQLALVAVPLVPLLVYDLPGRWDDAADLLRLGVAARAFFLWLRPYADRARHVPADRRLAERLVQEHGTDSLAYFALRHDKSAFFSPSGRSFLPYRVLGGTAIVSGDPIGDASERTELISEFRRVAHAKAWRVAIAGASAEALPEYAALGFKAVYLGDEAFVRPETFSPEGRPIRKVRQSVSRLEKAGYRVELVAPDDVEPALRGELMAVSAEWRGNWPERGFTMAMDAVFAYPDTMLAVAYAPDGTVGGFLQL